MLSGKEGGDAAAAKLRFQYGLHGIFVGTGDGNIPETTSLSHMIEDIGANGFHFFPGIGAGVEQKILTG